MTGVSSTGRPIGGAEGYRLLTRSVGAVALTRDVLVCRGPDTVKFLHSLLSQDIAGMAAGEVRWSFLLQPTGKLVALLRVHRLADPAEGVGGVGSAGDAVVLEVDAGAGAALHTALTRFKIRTKCEITLHAAVLTAVRGPAAAPVASAAEMSVSELLEKEATVIAPAGPWWDRVEFDALSLSDERVALGDRVAVVDPAVYEVLRIERGVPMHGRELTDATIPNETGLVPVAVNRTKGCYLGQELVERIDSRGGNTPHHFRALDLAGAVVPTNGRATLAVEGKDVGVLTSAAYHPVTLQVVALGFVHRSVGIGASVAIVWDGGSDLATVRELPAVS